MRKIKSTVKSVFEAVLLAKLLWGSFDNNTNRARRSQHQFPKRLSV
ncbi:MAG: hypothetical protein ACM3QW_00630 [Ignavibacteriales bacterium]